MKLTILGPPRTKKNHTRRIKRGRRIFHVQSEAHEAWVNAAVLQLRSQWNRISVDGGPWLARLNLTASVYREKSTGDLGNYLAAVCDALQAAGVVENDSFIQGFDGSRLFVDRHVPRVEIQLTPLDGMPDYVMHVHSGRGRADR